MPLRRRSAPLVAVPAVVGIRVALGEAHFLVLQEHSSYLERVPARSGKKLAVGTAQCSSLLPSHPACDRPVSNGIASPIGARLAKLDSSTRSHTRWFIRSKEERDCVDQGANGQTSGRSSHLAIIEADVGNPSIGGAVIPPIAQGPLVNIVGHPMLLEARN